MPYQTLHACTHTRVYLVCFENTIDAGRGCYRCRLGANVLMKGFGIGNILTLNDCVIPADNGIQQLINALSACILFVRYTAVLHVPLMAEPQQATN